MCADMGKHEDELVACTACTGKVNLSSHETGEYNNY
jgi:hypothetical protein